MANTLSDEDLLMLENVQTEEAWTAACRQIKGRREGQYPEYPIDWYEKVIASGLLGRVAARWGDDGEIRIVPIPDSFRGGGL